jgi:outer membrane protein assembly factor BamB
VAGGKVAASDYRGRVRIFDVKSGAEEGQVTLSDKAEAITSAPGDKAQVWVKVKDGRDVLVDLASRRATNAKRPAWAAEPYWADTHCRFHSPNTKCVERSARAPVGKELVVDRVMSDGDLRVAVARKYPGTEIAFLLGFKEGAKAAAWKAQVVEGDPVIAQPGTTIPVELGGGRAIAVYDMTNSGGKHMTAFDAKTGDRLWNVHLPFDPAGHYSVRVTETRVYFPYAAVLWAFDARTGKLVGQIGK